MGRISDFFEGFGRWYDRTTTVTQDPWAVGPAGSGTGRSRPLDDQTARTSPRRGRTGKGRNPE